MTKLSREKDEAVSKAHLFCEQILADWPRTLADRERSLLANVDWEIAPLVAALRHAGLDTDWACSGEPGHMVIRPTIQIKTAPFLRSRELRKMLCQCEKVLAWFGLSDYFLSYTLKRGAFNTHGGEGVIIIELMGRFDWVALPLAYSRDGQTADNCLGSWTPEWRRIARAIDLHTEKESKR